MVTAKIHWVAIIRGGVSGLLAMLLTVWTLSPSAAYGQAPDGPEDADESLPTDPVLRLQERIRAGTVTLEHEGEHGYLRALLEAFDIPISSQGLVFSRTSLQTDRVSPWTPRALYFNDDVYIGWVQESPILEIASVDPVEGPAFYTLSQAETDQPSFLKETTTCLMCHESRVTRGVPGFIVRSVLTDRHGYVISSVHEGGTTDKWSQLGLTVPGCDDEMVLVSRQNNSGTYVYFKEAVLGKKRDYKLGTRDMHGSKDVVDLVEKTPCAIGYSGLAYATDHVKLACIVGKDGGDCVNPSTATAIDGTYPIARPLFMYTSGEPTGKTKEYLDWILSDAGQCIILDKGYAPVRNVTCS